MSLIQACVRSVTLAIAALAAALSPWPDACALSSTDRGDSELTVSGIVVRDDGTPPPFGTILERDCGNGFTKEGDVQPSGYFSFSSSRNVLSNRAKADLSGSVPSTWALAMEKREQPPPFEMRFCLLRAHLSGYRSATARLPADPGTTKVDIGKIVLYPELRSKESSIRLTAIQIPAQARKSLRHAVTSMRKLKLDKALEELTSAISLYPTYVEAWYQIGRVHQYSRQYSQAQKAFQEAIALDPDYLPACLGLASVAWHQQDWPMMLHWSSRCLKLSPLASPEAYFLNAMALYRIGMLDAAEEIARKGMKVDVKTEYRTLHLLLGEILLGRRDMQGSIQELRSYLRLAPKAPDAAQVRAVMENREKQLIVGSR